ncbi:MAG: DNA primase [Deltaproteobacteria bacterium]|nr:DNA primase [Deltaproteobacteria bacterium]
MLSKSFLTEIRERLPISSYVHEKIPLKKSGRNFKGCCPFHTEKTPSFMVNDEKGIYHCFGCAEGGDLIRFVMKFEGLSFIDAVKQLAARAGLAMPKDEGQRLTTQDTEREKRRKWALRVNDIARDFFVANLSETKRGESARNYLKNRGILDSFWTQHFLGYADKSWDALSLHLAERGAPLELAEELGLVRKREGGGYYDFFRNRIIFPILSPRGEVLAFGGRTLDDAGESAKYLNSPDSTLYHKSSCMFGLYQALASIREQDEVVIVEGYMDALALAQAGIQNVVAPLGTALTDGHVRLLTRSTRKMVMLFDGDEAGKRAQMRSLPIFLEAGLIPKAVSLPPGEDPDSFIRKEGEAAVRRLIEKAETLFEFFMDQTLRAAGNDLAGKVEAMRDIAPWLAKVNDPVEAALYRKQVSDRLGVAERVVLEAVTTVRRTGRIQSDLSDRSEGSDEILIPTAERLLVRALIRCPHLIPSVLPEVNDGELRDEWCRMMIAMMQTALTEGVEMNSSRWLEMTEDVELAAEIRTMMLEETMEEDEAKALVRDCLQTLKRRPIAERLKTINADIAQAEAEGNEQRVLELLATKQQLTINVKQRGDYAN